MVKPFTGSTYVNPGGDIKLQVDVVSSVAIQTVTCLNTTNGNSRTGQLTGTLCKFDVINLNNGVNNIVFTATDINGGTGTLTVTVTRQ